MATAVKRKNAVSAGTEKICSLNVKWILEGKGHYLDDRDIEHIQNCLIHNQVSGELCTLTHSGKKIWGYWRIQF